MGQFPKESQRFISCVVTDIQKRNFHFFKVFIDSNITFSKYEMYQGRFTMSRTHTMRRTFDFVVIQAF